MALLVKFRPLIHNQSGLLMRWKKGIYFNWRTLFELILWLQWALMWWDCRTDLSMFMATYKFIYFSIKTLKRSIYIEMRKVLPSSTGKLPKILARFDNCVTIAFRFPPHKLSCYSTCPQPPNKQSFTQSKVSQWNRSIRTVTFKWCCHSRTQTWEVRLKRKERIELDFN